MNSAQSQFADELSPKFRNVYLDSSAFLAYVKKEEKIAKCGLKRYEVVGNILEDTKNKKIKLFTSAITLAEVRRLKESTILMTNDELKEINKLFDEFLEHDWINLIEINRDIAENAQKLGALYGIFPMDSLHIASAQYWDCDVLMLWDKKTVIDKIPSKLGSLTICEPYWEGISRLKD